MDKDVQRAVQEIFTTGDKDHMKERSIFDIYNVL